MKPRQFAVLIILAGFSVALYLAIQPRRRAEQTRNCQTNLKLIGLGMMQYVRDYDEKYPVAARWADDLVPYSINHNSPARTYENLFRCPTSASYYAFNGFYTQLSMTADETPATSPLAYDVSAGHNAPNLSGSGSLWPISPVHEFGPKRGNNVLFADAHVKMVSAKPGFGPIRPTQTTEPKGKP